MRLFIVAWLFCLLFYFMEYAVRSAPSVMLPELTTAFGLTTLVASSTTVGAMTWGVSFLQEG